MINIVRPFWCYISGDHAIFSRYFLMATSMETLSDVEAEEERQLIELTADRKELSRKMHEDNQIDKCALESMDLRIEDLKRRKKKNKDTKKDECGRSLSLYKTPAEISQTVSHQINSQVYRVTHGTNACV